MIDGHPLDPFAEWFGGGFFGGGIGQVVSSQGYASAWGGARALGIGSHGGETYLEGYDDGLLIAHGQKGGQAEARSMGAPWVIEHGEHGGLVTPLLHDHPYLIALGEKSITAAVGWAVTFGHARLVGLGQKDGPGFGNAFDRSYADGHGFKGGHGRQITIEAGELLARFEKRGNGFALKSAAPRITLRGEHGGPGYGPVRGAPYIEVFGVKVGGGTVGEGFALIHGHGFLELIGAKGGEATPLLDDEGYTLARGSKAGTGFGRTDAFPRLLLEGLHGGQALVLDPAFTLAHGMKSASGSPLTVAHVYVLANGSAVIVLSLIPSKSGPAAYDPMFTRAL